MNTGRNEVMTGAVKTGMDFQKAEEASPWTRARKSGRRDSFSDVLLI